MKGNLNPPILINKDIKRQCVRGNQTRENITAVFSEHRQVVAHLIKCQGDPIRHHAIHENLQFLIVIVAILSQYLITPSDILEPSSALLDGWADQRDVKAVIQSTTRETA